MLDLVAFTVCVEAGFAFADAPELAAVVCQDLSGFSVIMNSLVEQPYHVLSGSFREDPGCSYESAVVI